MLIYSIARTRTHYEYPPSPTLGSPALDPLGITRAVPLSHRLRALQIELTALENELADPSNPLIQKEREEENVDPGELIRGLVDVRTRLDRIKKGKEGRAKLVGAVLESGVTSKIGKMEESSVVNNNEEALPHKSEMQTMVDIDRRMGELENLVGSSSTSLDEVSLPFSFAHRYLAQVLSRAHPFRRLSFH